MSSSPLRMAILPASAASMRLRRNTISPLRPVSPSPFFCLQIKDRICGKVWRRTGRDNTHVLTLVILAQSREHTYLETTATDVWVIRRPSVVFDFQRKD